MIADLCRGPHIDSTSEIGAIKLTRPLEHIGEETKTKKC